MTKKRDEKGRFVAEVPLKDHYTFWGTREENPLDFRRILQEAEEDGRNFVLVTMAGSKNAVVGCNISREFYFEEDIYLSSELLYSSWGQGNTPKYSYLGMKFLNGVKPQDSWRFREVNTTEIRATIKEIEIALEFHEKKFQTRRKTTVKRW